MKKLLLLCIAFSLCLFSIAQQRDFTKSYKAQIRPLDVGLNNAETSINQNGGNYPVQTFNGDREILKTQISSSSNVFGIFTLDQVVLTTEPDLNFVCFGNRAGGPMGATGNDLRVCWSDNLGIDWTNFVITPGIDNKWFRYPSVTFYNPTGNTDPANMYAIFSGPYTNATGWEGQYWGSVKFDGTTNKDITFEVNQANTYLNHMNIGLNVTPTGKVHVASQRLNGTEASYTSVGFEVLNGTFNTTTNKVDWDLPRVAVPTQLGDDNRIDASDLVFSPDGTVGYLIGNGIDLDETYNPYGVEWPVVYKTVDDGATWEKIEPFDFSTIQVFTDMLWPLRADPNTVIPRWYNKYIGGNRYNGATVDINGNLHLTGIVLGTYSIDIDSLSNFYTEQPKLMFDVYMTTGGWDAVFVDSVRTDPVDAADTPFGMGWDQLIQMSRTKEGGKVFAGWIDTDPTLWGGDLTTNTQPDIYTWGRDVLTGVVTPPVNRTMMGDYWGDNFWLHVGDKVLNGPGEYQIPMTTSASSASGGTQNDPMNHYYVSGVNIMVSVNNIDPLNDRVSQNYPNPFNQSTKITLTLDKSAQISIDIFNLIGQKVITVPSRTYAAGDNTVEISANGLEPGVYIYSITANGQRVSHKMTVK
jgi:hypothetical protein